jgi:hypothetical protein
MRPALAPLAALLALALAPQAAHADETRADAELGLTFSWPREAERLPAQGLACGAPFLEEVEAAMPPVRAILLGYGRDVLSRMGLRKVRLCRELVVRFAAADERRIDGALDRRTEQAVGGLAVYAEATIYVDVAAALRGQALTTVMQHELFHFVDQVLVDATFRDAWSALNPPDFRYGGGGLAAMGTEALLPSEHPGFATTYARTAAVEDRAELYAAWRTEPAALGERLPKDPVLTAKLRLLERRLRAKLPALAERTPKIP